MARPTDYNETILKKAKAYTNSPLPEDEKVHSIEGLAISIGVARSTIYDWASQEDKKEFSDILDEVLERQAKSLVNNGLGGTFNSSITKVMLSKHGYREATDVDVTTKGKEINTIDPKTIAIAKRYEEEIKKDL